MRDNDYSEELPWAALPFRILAYASGFLAFVIFGTTIAAFACQTAFGHILFGADEVCEIALGLLVFTALPLVIHHREMILLTITSDRFPPAGRRLTDALGDLTGALLFAVIAWRLWDYGGTLGLLAEQTVRLQLPKALVVQAMSAVAAFASLACFMGLVSIFLRRRHGAPLQTSDLSKS